MTAYHYTLENIQLSPEHYNTDIRVAELYAQTCKDVYEKENLEDLLTLQRLAKVEFEDYLNS